MRSAIYARLAVFTYSDTLSIIYTGWNLNRLSDLLGIVACTVTCRTLILYYLARTTAGWTCCDILHYSKQRLTLSDNLTCTITLGTCLRRCARLSSVAATGRACLLIVELKLLCAAKYSFLKRNSYTETDICTLCRTISSTTASSPPKKSPKMSPKISPISMPEKSKPPAPPPVPSNAA